MKSKLLATFGLAMTVVCGGVDASKMAQDMSQEQHDMSPKEIFQYLKQLKRTYSELNEDLIADIENVVGLIQKHADQYLELFKIYESSLDDPSFDVSVMELLLNDFSRAFGRDLLNLHYCNNVLHYNSNLLSEEATKLEQLGINCRNVLNRKLSDKKAQEERKKWIQEQKEQNQKTSAIGDIVVSNQNVNLPPFTQKERSLREWNNLATYGNEMVRKLKEEYEGLNQAVNNCKNDSFLSKKIKRLKKELQTVENKLKEAANAANELYQESMDSPTANEMIQSDLGSQYYAFIDLQSRIDALLQGLPKTPNKGSISDCIQFDNVLNLSGGLGENMRV